MAPFAKRQKAAPEKGDDDARQVEKKYRTLLDNASDAILLAGVKGNLLEGNKKAEELLGYTRKEMLGINISQIHPQEEWARISKTFKEISKNGFGAIINTEILRKDGGRVFVDITGSVIEYGRKRIVQGIFRDVSERKKMEDELRKSEQKYRDILETTRDGYFELDMEGNYTFANASNCRFLGYAKEELIGKNYRIHTSKEAAEKVIRPYRELYETGKPIEALELESFTKGGRKVIHETSVSLIRDEEGRPVGFRGVSRDVTERKQMEEKLRGSEEKYRTILESIDDGYYEIDLEGNYIFFNAAEARNLGYSREEMLGVSPRKYQDEETYKRTRKAFIELYRTGQPIKSLEMEAIRKDGTRVFNEISASLMRDHQGKPVGFRGITRDVTARKKAETALKESEKKYRFLTESMTDILWIAGLDLRTIYVTPSIQKVLGFIQEERIRQNLDEQLTPDSLLRALHILDSELAREEKGDADPERRINMELEFYHKDGSTRWLDVVVSGIRDDQGVLTSIYGAARDITERKKMEEAIYESEKRYRTIMDEMEEGYFELDLRGNTTFFNDAISRIFGYSPEEARGMNYRQYTDKENAEKCRKIYSEIYRTGNKAKIREYEIIRKDKTKRHLETDALLSRDAAGKTVGFRGISRDITERKRAEEALRKNNEELIKKNEEIEESRRNVQFALEKLGQAYEELKVSQAKILQQEKMASIGQLAAGVAHEINNPVAFIASNLGTLDKYIRRFLDFMQKQEEVIKAACSMEALETLEKISKELKLDYIKEDVPKLLWESLDGTDRVQKRDCK